MHEYEQVKKDIINSVKYLNDGGVIFVHDCLPRGYFEQAVPRSQHVWTGDVWKLIPIFNDSGLTRNIRLLTLAPSGLLAVYNPKKEIIYELERNYQKICNKWIDKILDKSHLKEIYHSKIFEKPENFTKFIQKHDIGENKKVYQKKWVSH